MKRNSISRKTLSIILCLVLTSIFTLTIAYAALSAVLTIQGNAEVTASTWNIYLDNAILSPGSEDASNPTITGTNKVEFQTTLNQPGEFYEFTVDVVNAGTIDAMIASVIKTPELTTEQAKFLKYEVTYENGEPITTKQTLSKGTTTPIKIRIEYRKDLTSTDLPTTETVLDMSLTLEYIQSDGTGTIIPNNGVKALMIAGTAYDYDEGMTWKEWVNSSYNTNSYFNLESPNSSSSRISFNSECRFISYPDTSNSVGANEVIDGTISYISVSTSACK